MARLFLLLLVLSMADAGAQPASFGSSANPLETPYAAYGRPTGVAAVYAGPAFLGQSWQSVVAARLDGRVGPLSAGLGGTLHTGVDGLYEPETDELYDLARLIRYVRIDPRPSFPVYARLGPTQQMTLGSGHLVRDYRSDASRDERTIGAEIAVTSPGVTAGAFAGDARMNSTVGAFVEAHPAPGASSPLLRSVRLSLGGVHDFSLPADEAPTGFQVEVGAETYRLAALGLAPFVSYADYLHYGRSVGIGADLGTSAAIEAARARIRIAVFVNSEGFVPGYVGPFYQVSNLRDRIVSADSFFAETAAATLVGVPLGEVENGVDVLTEVELGAFRSFALFYHFRRHYGGQRLSDFSFRLAFQPQSLDGLRIALEIERQGLGSFFSLFNSDLQDQNTLVFDIDYPLSEVFHLSLRSHYGYRRLSELEDGEPRYLVQRRFEPLFGLRLRL